MLTLLQNILNVLQETSLYNTISCFCAKWKTFWKNGFFFSFGKLGVLLQVGLTQDLLLPEVVQPVAPGQGGRLLMSNQVLWGRKILTQVSLSFLRSKKAIVKQTIAIHFVTLL